jgi:hypothetical protein
MVAEGESGPRHGSQKHSRTSPRWTLCYWLPLESFTLEPEAHRCPGLWSSECMSTNILSYKHWDTHSHPHSIAEETGWPTHSGSGSGSWTQLPDGEGVGNQAGPPCAPKALFFLHLHLSLGWSWGMLNKACRVRLLFFQVFSPTTSKLSHWGWHWQPKCQVSPLSSYLQDRTAWMYAQCYIHSAWLQ